MKKITIGLLAVLFAFSGTAHAQTFTATQQSYINAMNSMSGLQDNIGKASLNQEIVKAFQQQIELIKMQFLGLLTQQNQIATAQNNVLAAISSKVDSVITNTNTIIAGSSALAPVPIPKPVSQPTVPTNIDPIFILASKASSKSATASQNNLSTSTLGTIFGIKVTTGSADMTFGTQTSGNPTFVFGIYTQGVRSTQDVASFSLINIPSKGVINVSSQSFTVPAHTVITIPVTFLSEGRTKDGMPVSTGNYAVGIESINWIANGTSASENHAGQSDWMSTTVPLP